MIVGDDYRIHTFLPPNYSPDQAYPTIYLLDGDWFTEDVAKEMERMIHEKTIPSCILIGIGYPENAGLKRFRDYTFSADSEYSFQTGEAHAFYTFVEEELIPWIDQQYLTDTTKRVLMGHSLGGLNTYYHLFQFPQTSFSGFVPVSASLWWKDTQAFALEEELKSRVAELPVQVYMAIGGDEPPSMTAINEEMVERMDSRQYSGLELEYIFYKGASHSQVPLQGFMDGLTFTLNH
ncbi:MAG: alpha/beta hydrolase-fold protein [Bacteroidota bacterium]